MELHAGTFRAARSLLDLKQAEVAARADVSRSLILRMEAGDVKDTVDSDMLKLKRTVHPDAVKLRLFYEMNGIEFLEPLDELGAGVRWDVDMGDGVVHRAYLRAGRALAGVRQAALAKQATVGQSLISRFESGETKSIPTVAFDAIVSGLRMAGVELLESSKGKAGVRLRPVLNLTAIK
jgi:transcriptional regulator with XRE-family HTH domain